MADIDVQHEENAPYAEDYTVLDVILWTVGILMIPLVPIVMITFLTPASGM